MCFLQETHSDVSNTADWFKEFDGLTILSHCTSLSGGVAMLFSKSFIPCSFSVDEVIKGRLLKVNASFENSSFVFICVYVPTTALERMVFLHTLDNVLRDCNTDDFLLLGGDFNCTEDAIDRNHIEPHMQSRKRLIQLIKSHSIIDVWRNFHGIQRQYTWAHAHENQLSLARLDRFYVFKHQLSMFRECLIIPVCFSDHSLIKCAMAKNNLKSKSAFWHFNNNLLCDSFFKEVFKEFWKNAKAIKSSFLMLQQWWDFVKVQIRQLCQQYTFNATRDVKESMSGLEKDLLKLQGLAELTKDANVIEDIKKKKNSLAEMFGLATQGAIIRSRFQSAELMDAPSKFFFSLEKKNGQKKFIHALRSEAGVLLTNPLDIRERALSFYKALYKSEVSEINNDRFGFFENLPQISEDVNKEISKKLSLGELEDVIKSMENGKSPGIDGITVEFYKAFWPEVGPELLTVFNESLVNGQLPRSCRRAIITLLPKKGDLNEITNWRPVSLLCNDYKILSKAIAIRLGKVIDFVVHPDQSYCVPGRRIFENISFIRDILDCGKLFDLDFGLISIDQEKAFDRVEHVYLWSVLEAFGFGPDFISMVKVFYCGVESVLKINGDLCFPFKVYRGVRQGCALSGMLYSLAIEPFLNKLRTVLCGLHIPNCLNNFKLSAYADDVIVLINGTSDVKVLLKVLGDFKTLSSANVNWRKSEAILIGKWSGGEPKLPDGLRWTREGFKYLGVFLGN